MYDGQHQRRPGKGICWIGISRADQLAPKVQTWAQQNYPSAWDSCGRCPGSITSTLLRSVARQYPGATKGYNPPPSFNAHAIVTQEMADAGIPSALNTSTPAARARRGSHNYVVFDAKNLETACANMASACSGCCYCHRSLKATARTGSHTMSELDAFLTAWHTAARRRRRSAPTVVAAELRKCVGSNGKEPPATTTLRPQNPPQRPPRPRQSRSRTRKTR